MKVDCGHCGKTLNIPDEKIPLNKKVSITCPACKNKIAVEKPPVTGKTMPSKEPDMEEQQETIKIIDPSQFAGEEFETLEEGAKRALVCDTIRQEQIIPILKKMDYITKVAKATDEGMGRMKFTQYDLVILAEDFAGSSPENNSVLRYIQPMPMTTRRNMFVALLGNNFRTLDNMTAFTLSVNVVINFKDMENLATILKKSISDYEVFYKVFNETLVAVGKA